MGCWNKTCAISQFPIFHGDETVTFVLVSNPQLASGSIPNQPSYCNAYWDVIPMPIFGKYDDYGGQEDHPKQKYKYDALREFFKDKLIADPNARKDDEAPSNPFKNAKSLRNSIQYNTFAVESHGGHWTKTPRAIATIMIHRNVFDAVCNGIWGHDSQWEPQLITRDALVLWAEEYKTLVANQPADPIPVNKEEEVELLLKKFRGAMSGGQTELMDKFLQDHQLDQYGETATVLRQIFCSRSYGSTMGLPSQWFYSQCHKVPAKDSVDGVLLCTAFDLLRKTFIPQGSEGSQERISQIHTALVQSMQELIDKDEAQRNE